MTILPAPVIAKMFFQRCQRIHHPHQYLDIPGRTDIFIISGTIIIWKRRSESIFENSLTNTFYGASKKISPLPIWQWRNYSIFTMLMEYMRCQAWTISGNTMMLLLLWNYSSVLPINVIPCILNTIQIFLSRRKSLIKLSEEQYICLVSFQLPNHILDHSSIIYLSNPLFWIILSN